MSKPTARSGITEQRSPASWASPKPSDAAGGAVWNLTHCRSQGGKRSYYGICAGGRNEPFNQGSDRLGYCGQFHPRQRRCRQHGPLSLLSNLKVTLGRYIFNPDQTGHAPAGR
jgi:hypothetical protein